MLRNGYTSFLLCIILISFSVSDISADERILLNLEQCIERAIRLSPEVAEASYEVRRLEAKRVQAEGSYYPQIEVLAITAPSPRARGDQVYSPDDSRDPVISGIFGKTEITLIQPIHTFGKLSSLKEAAESGIRVTEAERDKVLSNIILRTKQLYYTIQLTRALRTHIIDIKETILEAIEKVDKRIEKGLPTADIVDRYKLMTFLGEVEMRLNEVDKNLSIAKEALRTSIGIKGDVEFDIVDEPFTPLGLSPMPIDEGINRAIEFRPEFVQLRKGIEARKSLLEAEKSNYYPILFLGVKGSIASASNRDSLHNPFVFDEFNHSYASAFLGIKWSIDLGITKGRVMEAEAEIKKLLEKKRFAEEGIPFEVKKVYMDIDEARKNIEALDSSYKNAKKWLVSALANFDMGVGEAKDVVDAIEMFALTRADYLKAVYNERMAFANLYHVTGMDLIEKGVEE